MQQSRQQSHASQNSYHCLICHYETTQPRDEDLGSCRGNTQRFKNQIFNLWRCPQCLSIHSLEKVDYDDIYKDYCLNQDRPLDLYARRTFKNLIRRLQKLNVTTKQSVLDYGCGSGTLLEFLKSQNYKNVSGYDPHVKEFKKKPEGRYDVIILNDVLEHVDDPIFLLKEVLNYLKPQGLLYVGTADSEGVHNMKDLDTQLMRLHQPFHRILITQKTLQNFGHLLGLKELSVYRRSYMDTLWPFSNYRFLDEYSCKLGHVLEKSLDSANVPIVFKHPRLLFYGLFGYFFPSAYEPAVIWQKI